MKDAHKDQDRLKSLILQAKSGDARAFEEIYNTYYTPIFRYILLRLKDKQESEDMAQSVFLKIYNSIANWNPDHTSVLAFFFTVTRNTLIDYFRKNSRREIISDEIVSIYADSYASDDEASRDAQSSEDRQSLREAINKLSREQQEIITMLYMNDLTYKEIASVTGKREDAIRQIHSRAIKKLRQIYIN